jgi:hypothetical protein
LRYFFTLWSHSLYTDFNNSINSLIMESHLDSRSGLCFSLLTAGNNVLSVPGSKSPQSPWSRHVYSSPLHSTYSQNSYSSLFSSPSLSRPDNSHNVLFKTQLNFVKHKYNNSNNKTEIVFKKKIIIKLLDMMTFNLGLHFTR